MYGFSKLSGKWYGRRFVSIQKAMDWVRDVANNGDVACICDDVEYFCEQMDLQIDDIEIVEPE